MASVDQLLGVLPPFTNEMVLIESVQEVPDIIKEVIESHKYFADDYNHIWEFFYTGSIEQTCRKLFKFCKENIDYVVESENKQTTKSPAAMLGLGHGDCKHYAGFIAGVLSAIARNTGEKIDCVYRFASYDHFNSEPGHVFVVVMDKKNSWWIDPVLGSFDERLEPAFFIDKKISTMPLYRVSGIGQPSGSPFYREFYEAVDNAGIGFVEELASEVTATGFENFTNFISDIFGGDDVPNYPVKESSTFNSLKASVIEWVGMVVYNGGVVEGTPPRTIEEAKIMLAKAIKRKNEETALGHGYGDGVGWDTLQMLYDETIRALQSYINQGGAQTPFPTQTTYPQTTLPGQTTYPQTPLPGDYPTGEKNFLNSSLLFGIPNWVLIAAGAAYYFSRKRSPR